MKINEIASRRLDEAPPGITPAVKYVGPYFDKAAAAAAKLFGVGKGTTQAELDALRAADTGAAKAAGGRPQSTVSSDELNALLYPPRAAKPTSGSFLKRRGDQGFEQDASIARLFAESTTCQHRFASKTQTSSRYICSRQRSS